MPILRKDTPEHQIYKVLEHWQPTDEILMIKELTNPKKKLSSLFAYLYEIVKKEYTSFPTRKNGKNPFVHPLNVVWDLRKAKVENEATICAALIHDLIEEKVDYYKRLKHLSETPDGVKKLDQYEDKLWVKFEKDLKEFSEDARYHSFVKQILEVVLLLTRHKRHFYYRSISSLFNREDDETKEMAIQIKLADRIHNLQSLDCFIEEDRMYQCFKTLFILNNTKAYLKKKYGQESNPDKAIHPTEKLFKKCCKATYDAFLMIERMCLAKGITPVESMLQLAFMKYAWEKSGLGQVTSTNLKETHPMCLYQGIIRKYDSRLHQEWDQFKQMKQLELKYCQKFFADYNFTSEQLGALMYYKDAYALKEVVALLLYDPDYVVKGFGCAGLCRRGFVCMKKK